MHPDKYVNDKGRQNLKGQGMKSHGSKLNSM